MKSIEYFFLGFISIVLHGNGIRKFSRSSYVVRRLDETCSKLFFEKSIFIKGGKQTIGYFFNGKFYGESRFFVWLVNAMRNDFSSGFITADQIVIDEAKQSA